MDLFKIFTEIEKIDGEVYERFDTRRRAFKHMAGLGKAVTVATMPALLSTMFNKAYGQTTTALTPDMKAVLNLALQLEYLEFHYYDLGLKANVIPASDVEGIKIIRDDEAGHISALQTVLGTDAIPDPGAEAFDYTAGGKLGGDPFASAALYYGTSQAFVDTGVRAYKGGAPKLMANKDVLTAALNIHSVEARHSSHIRMMRRVLANSTNGGDIGGGIGNMNPKSWVSLKEYDGPKPDLTAPVYGLGATLDFPAENNVTQGGVNIQTTTAYPTSLMLNDIQKQAAVTESFDEPLDADTVKAIARNFRSPLGVTKGLFV